VTAAVVFGIRADAALAGVSDREYRRLLGLPRGREFPGEMAEGADGARQWYAAHGRPFIATRRIELRDVSDLTVTLATGDVLTSAVLADRLRKGEAHALVVLAASAGPEVAEEARRLWAAGELDAGYYLDRLAAVVTERLVSCAATTLCRDGTAPHEWPLPHLSPGCGHWDLADQHRLMAVLLGLAAGQAAAATGRSCGPVTLLESGMLRPQHSLLAAFGVTRRERVPAVGESCRACDLDPCDYRRVPYVQEILRPSVTP
jgi:hypothetical protein